MLTTLVNYSSSSLPLHFKREEYDKHKAKQKDFLRSNVSIEAQVTWHKYTEIMELKEYGTIGARKVDQLIK